MLGILEAQDAGFMPHFRIDKHRSFSHWKLYIPEMDVEGPFMLVPSAETIMANNFWVASTSLATRWLLVKVAGQAG